MATPMDSHRSAEPPERPASLRYTRAHPLALVADRPRRIDSWIDYFGTGEPRRTAVSAPPRDAA